MCHDGCTYLLRALEYKRGTQIREQGKTRFSAGMVVTAVEITELVAAKRGAESIAAELRAIINTANAPIFGRVSNVKVKPPRCGGREYSCAESAWLGGCKLAMAPGFAQPDASGNQMYATDDDYDEKGPELICNEMNILRNDDEL